MTLDLSVDRLPTPGATTAAEPVESRRAFPTADLVKAAAGLFAREVQPERRITVGHRVGASDADEGAWWQTLGPVRDSTRPADRSVLQLLALGWAPLPEKTPRDPEPKFSVVATETAMVEGPRWFVEVSPGVVAVRSSDPARRNRTMERQEDDRQARVDLEAAAMARGEVLPEPQGRMVRVWSAKSRAMMTRRLGQLDYTPMIEHGRRLCLVTLTYPGDWLTVAPDASTCHGHLLKLRKRYERRFKVPMVAAWKREFQRRGAPHYHLLMAEPPEHEDGQTFRSWLADTWAAVVGHPDPEQHENGRAVGTRVDYSSAGRVLDPKRAAVYFSKHGSFAAKDYQNDPPPEWDDTASVGRFWGYWHLSLAVAGVEVAPDVARSVVRAARRYSDAQAGRVRVHRWRKRTWETLDPTTGELVKHVRWRKRSTLVPIRRLRRSSGFLAVNDGPAFAGQLARWSALAVAPDRPGIAATGMSGRARASGAARPPLPPPLRRGFLP